MGEGAVIDLFSNKIKFNIRQKHIRVCSKTIITGEGTSNRQLL